MTLRSFLGNQLRRAGLQIAEKVPDLADFLASRQVSTVLDIGANKGQFGFSLRDRGYRGRIISFEPVSSAFRRLQHKTRHDKDWTAIQCAIGAEAGEASINISEHSPFNSLQALSPAGRKFSPGSVQVGVEPIEVRTIDSFLNEFEPANTFLKIDTQGYERQVLAGAPKTLERVVGVQLEVPLIHLYEGVWSLEESVSAMATAGFVPCQVRPVAHHPDDPSAAVELDVVFRRRSALD